MVVNEIWEAVRFEEKQEIVRGDKVEVFKINLIGAITKYIF